MNDAPFNSLPAPQATRVDTAILFSMANGNRLAIGDKEATIFTVRLNAVGGRLHVTNLPAGLTVSGNDTTAVILTGSLASINAALDGLSFVPNTGFQGSGSLTVITNDLGVAGAGGALTDTDTLQISVRNPQQVEGRTLILTGTVASDSIAVVFDTTSDYRASVNGVTQSYSTTSVDQILILSGAGADTIDVTDAPGSDIATFAAGYATIAHANYRFDIYSPRIYVRGDVLDSSTFNNSGPVNAYLLREYAIMQATDNSFFNEAINFGSHTANASGDDDTLFLYGEAGNQTYVGTFNQALLVSTDRRLTGNNFKSVYVYGISGTDNATVIGTSGDERVDAYPTYVRVTSGAKLQYLSQFDVVSVRSGGGAKDVANFYDSAGNDTFVSRPDYSTFTGTGFRIVVQDFDIVHAIHSAGGTDVATLTGSTGNDTFTGTATTSILIAASGMRQQVSGYSRVTVMASSGNDVATLVDSSGNDTLTAKSDYAELLYSAGNRITVKAFDAVYARGLNGGTNRKLVTDPLAFQLRFSGTWV